MWTWLTTSYELQILNSTGEKLVACGYILNLDFGLNPSSAIYSHAP